MFLKNELDFDEIWSADASKYVGVHLLFCFKIGPQNSKL